MKKFLVLCFTILSFTLLNVTSISAQDNNGLDKFTFSELNEIEVLDKNEISPDDLVPSDNNEQIIIYSVEPPTLAEDIGQLAASSIKVQGGSTKGGQLYLNPGNYNAGLTQMHKIGGRGEAYPFMDNGVLKWRKDGIDGTALYYKSTSFTDDLQRWTIHFPGYKIRFMGD